MSQSVIGPISCEKASQLQAMLHKDNESILEVPFNANRDGFGVFVSDMVHDTFPCKRKTGF